MIPALDPETYYNKQPKESAEQDEDLAFEYYQELHGAFNSEEL